MNGFGISSVVAILLVGLLSVIIIMHGVTERKEQAQADGITQTNTYLSSIIAFKRKLDTWT